MQELEARVRKMEGEMEVMHKENEALKQKTSGDPKKTNMWKQESAVLRELIRMRWIGRRCTMSEQVRGNCKADWRAIHNRATTPPNGPAIQQQNNSGTSLAKVQSTAGEAIQ